MIVDDGRCRRKRTLAHRTVETAPMPQGRLLLVEGSRTIAALADTWLREWGLDVDRPQSADEALCRVAQGGFDMMLGDASLTVQGGDFLLCAARNHAPGLPIIALIGRRCAGSALADPRTIELRKPFDRSDLRDAVDAALAARGEAMSIDPTALPLIDKVAMCEIWPAGEHALYERIAVLFSEEANGRCATIQAAIKSLDRDIIRHEAHSLKGGAANVCAARLAAVSATREKEAATVPASLLAASVARLIHTAHETIDILRTATIGADG
jgi:HPt (histidine-containing phosphotransfer) domain-containing protein/CheY-like chemotaxis protein